MKAKMYALDVRAAIGEMESLIGLRLINVYDIGSKLFLLKFGHGDNKKMVLIESGVRIHVTNLVREKPKMPSQFTFKIRKHIKSWRLDTIFQLEGDRTIVLKFGSDQTSFHLVIELFAKGNIILTDHEFTILTLLRAHREGDTKYAVKEKYPMPQGGLGSASQGLATEAMMLSAAESMLSSPASPSMTLKQLLSSLGNFGPQLAEHAILLSRLAPNAKVSSFPSATVLLSSLAEGLVSSWKLLHDPLPPGGCLVCSRDSTSENTDQDSSKQQLTALQIESKRFTDFAPVVLEQFKDPALSVTVKQSFGEVCDLFFVATETDRIDQHNEKKDSAVNSAKDRFLRDHARRISKLETEEELNMRKGRMLELNADAVQEVIDLMNMLLAMKLSWEKIGVLVKARRSEGHPVAYMIHEINFERNSVTVLLEEDLEEGEDDNDVEPLAVEVDLSLNAQRNASRYYTMKKQVHAKLEKTIAATDKAADGAARKGQRVSAKHGTAKKEVIAQRKTMWFEKFFWFVTTSGDLVVSGKDNQQTDLLVKRFMHFRDIFVHSDSAKALPCLVKAREGAPDVSLSSIQQAGSMCVARSSAWDSKASISAWWVSAAQVHRSSAGSGVHVNPGLYNVSGERNYLKPMPLSVSCGVLFRLATPQPPAPTDPLDPRVVLAERANVETDITVVEFPVAASEKKKGLSTKSIAQRSQGSTSGLETGSDDSKRPTSANPLPDKETKKVVTPANVSLRMKHKLKKIQKKYAEQDEDERLCRMQVLGNRPSKIHSLVVTQGGSQSRRDSDSENESTPCSEQGDKGAETSKKEVRFAAEEEPDHQEHNHSIPVDCNQSNVTAAATVDNTVVTDLSEIEFLSSSPKPDDAIQYAMLVCAPTAALIHYRYRADLLHGNEKKGAAALAVLHYFQKRVADASVLERNAISHLDAEQLHNQMLGNIKVRIPKVTDLQQHGNSSDGTRQKVHVDPVSIEA